MRWRQQTLARPTVDIGAGAGAPALERLKAIKFEVLREQDLLSSSVEQVTTRVQLTGAKLGLPALGETCLTCRATEFSDCPGHFGHIQLTEPIFHPSYIGQVKKFLEKICIACGQYKSKRGGPKSQVQTFLDALESTTVVSAVEVKAEEVIVAHDVLPCPTTVVRRPAATNSGPSSSAGNALWLSGKGKRKFDDASGTVGEGADAQNPPSYYFRPRKSRASKAEFVDLTLDDEEGEAPDTAGAEPSEHVHVEPEPPPSPVTVIPITVRPRKYQSTMSSKQQRASKLGESQQKKKSRGRRCKYCQPPLDRNADPYPKILLKLVIKQAGHTKDKIEVIQMEIDLKSDHEVPLDFWDFLGEIATEEEEDDELEFTTKRVLLASSALRILEKVSSDTRQKIGCLHPEDMILRHLPVPPNCTRVVDDTFNATAADYGDDPATEMLKRIMQRNNSSKLRKITATKQFELLQAEVGNYLRIKGAGKVTGALEPRLGQARLSEESLKTKWKNRLKDCVVGKLSNHCARSILTGDPHLSIEEIGIPDRIAGLVTVPVRVNRMNLQSFRDAIEEVANEGPRGSITSWGILYYERDEDLVDLKARNASWDPTIGDIAYRCLRDGDLVLANRNPSLHKHSLIAFKVRRHQLTTLTMNPLMCSPFNADFDGDALHIFAPQSFEALEEMVELMTVPAQMICPQGGQVMIHLSHDALLGAYLLTSRGVLMDVKTVAQVAAEGAWSIEKPAIIKTPKGGPYWTGAQVFGLSLPNELNYSYSPKVLGSGDELSKGVLVSKGQLLYCDQDSEWLGSSPEGIVRHICNELGAKESVSHLNVAQSILHRWLEVRGFSLGLDDIFASPDQSRRAELTTKVKEEFELAKLRVLNHPLVSGKLKPKSDVEYIDLDVHDELLERTEQTVGKTSMKYQEEIGIGEFRALSAAMEKVITCHMALDNSLLRMVKAGSKGSMSKIVQQSGLLGLQLNVGGKLFPPKKSCKMKYCMPSPSLPEDEAWGGAGVVGASYLEGLNPLEFFSHAVSSRLATISHCLEVKEPGSLFKNMMAFMRDLYVPYDGTVRHRIGQKVIQLFYGGALAGTKVKDEKGMREICSASAGEPVGALAVTALVQPIYQAILDTHHLGGRDMRPLQLLQDTLLPRMSSAPKASDRIVILRLQKPAVCRCNVAMYGCSCTEKVALQVQNHLCKVLLRDVAKNTAIHYHSGDDDELSPWVGHVQLSQDSLVSYDLTVEGVIFQLQSFVAEEKNSRIFGPVVFSNCSYCNITRSKQDSCIHFRTESSSKFDEHESLGFLRDILLPLLLRGEVKGSRLLKSVKLFWETKSSPTRISADGGEEVVVEVEVSGKQQRGKSFSTVKLACVPIMDLIDWSRSAPYGIQEIRQTHGIEATQFCVFHRLRLAVKGMGAPVDPHHLQVIADFMTHSGDAIGFMYAGYKDYFRNISATAPFSQAAFQAPWKSFIHAAQKGQSEEVTSVLASCAWGKKAPIGTAADCDILHRANGVAALFKDDVHELYAPIAAQVAEQTANHDLPGSPHRAGGEPGKWVDSSNPISHETDMWGAAKVSSGASGGWGDEPSADAVTHAGWGTEELATSGGWGGQDENTNSWSEDKASAWGEGVNGNISAPTPGSGSDGLPAKDNMGWDSKSPAANETESEWGRVENAPSAGWEDVTNNGTKVDGGGWEEEKTKVGGGGWEEEGTKVGGGGWEEEGTKAGGGGWEEEGIKKVGGGGSERDSARGAATVGLSEATWGNDTNGWDTPNQNADANKNEGIGGDKGTSDWDTSEQAAPGDATWGQAPSNQPNSMKFVPDRAPDKERKKKWETSCSGANLVPLGKKRSWPKVNSTCEEAGAGFDQKENKGGLGRDQVFGMKKAIAEEDRGWSSSDQKAASEATTARWGEKKAFEDEGDWGGDQSAALQGGQADTEGWGEKKASADEGGWGGDQPAESQVREADPAGWGKEEAPEDEGGWGGHRHSDLEARDDDDAGWGGAQSAEMQHTAEEAGGWGSDQPARSARSVDQSLEQAASRDRSVQDARAENGRQNSRVSERGPAQQQEARCGQDLASIDLSDNDREVQTEIQFLLQRCKDLVSTTGKLSDEDEQFVVDNVLRYHPEKGTQMGNAIKIDSHPDYPKTRCMFLMRSDGEWEAFSYHKCLQELARAKSRVVFENYSVLFKPRPVRRPLGGQE